MTRIFVDLLESRQMLSASSAQVDWLNHLPDAAPQIYDADAISSPANPAPSQTLAAPPPSPVTTILNNGPASNRIGLVLVGDGFQTSDMSLYAQDAQNIVNNFFNEAPLNLYKKAFNVYRVDVTSTDSGVDNDPTEGISKNTALDMAYFGGGIERLLTVNTTQAKIYAANAPKVDQVIAIANSSKYGGGGYSGEDVLTVAGSNSSAVEIAKHEFGHSFGDLADEYDYGGPDTWTGGEPSTADISIYQSATMQSMKTKWYRWLGSNGVGTFEGANYSVHGIYRPTQDSKMRSLGVSFGSVNTEQLILKIYQAVKPIDSSTAAGSYFVGDDFFVDPIDPSDHALNVQWYLDGSPIAGQTGTSFDSEMLGISGNHTLSVKVIDNTSLVRDESARAQWMTEQLSWTLVGGAGSIAGNVFNDVNSNGIKNAGDAGIKNWNVYLDANNNNAKDTGERSILTDTDGDYIFGSVVDGTYHVRQVFQSSYRKTNPGGGIPGYDVSISGGNASTGKTFGMTTNILLGGKVFNDVNSNGTLDGGENALAGFTINIRSNGIVIASRVTDANGQWRVQGLSAGTGTAELESIAGYTFTSPSDGKITGTMSSGQANANINFGVHEVSAAPLFAQGNAGAILVSDMKSLDLLADI